LTNFVFVALFALFWFKLSNLIIPLRSKKEDEIQGLDIPEMGAEAYPDYQLTDKSSPQRDSPQRVSLSGLRRILVFKALVICSFCGP
jgi:hypothetical protein